MPVLVIVGWALIVIGITELVFFGWLAPRRENIRRRMPLLVANSAVNVVLGAVLVAVG